MFSLQKLGLIKFTTTLCNNRNLLNLILQCNFCVDFPNGLYIRKRKEWESVQSMTNELISQICESYAVKKNVMKLLWPISRRIMLWKSIYAPFIENNFLEQFHWTDIGKIDCIRTANCIIGNKSITIRRRFVLACDACIDQEIRVIWAEMSNDDKMFFITEDNALIFFWLCKMNGTVSEYNINCAFDYAAGIGLLEAVKYLFDLLSLDERKAKTVRFLDDLYCKVSGSCFADEYEMEIAHFLLSRTNNENRKNLFMSSSGILSSFLLHSSDHELFLRVFAEVYNYVCLNDIGSFLLMLFYKFHFEDIEDCDYLNIFFDLWRIFPTRQKDIMSKLLRLGPQCLSVLIKHDFPFLIRENAIQKVEELASSDLQPCTAEPRFDFHQERWKFLLLLIQNVIVITRLKEIEGYFTVEISNWPVFESVLKYVREIGN